ncbi:serine/threonine-protein kinase [Nitriliruptor alkaliphilus]|uniref:serine/threonine-protein kinase n=1 Tax=Nitriliruptor alkaliphilus TaxID=427918 RepID=UPI00147030FF|nr:serine/threonine-protein kinase [Nitriliruptor alkaliphilus]
MQDEAPLVRDRWLCETRISDGPHGTVWRAWDQRLRRVVALRVVHAPLMGDPKVRRRIDRLLNVTAELQNDNMSYLYDVFEEDGLGVVLISELIDGPTLTEVRRQLGPLPSDAVAAIGSQLADGLAAIHAAGVAHRDLSPENVRITADGTVKILGFSAARLLADSTATPAAGVEDEANYLAPEQLDGGPSDQRSDVYALGLLLWELATGVHPQELAHASQAEGPGGPHEVPPLSGLRDDVPSQLSEAIEVATRPDPADRWPDAVAFGEQLGRLCSARPRLVLRGVPGIAELDGPAA